MPSSRKIEHDKRRDPERPRRRPMAQSEPADWSLADAALLVRLIVNVAGCGGAVRFGYTSDGGAYAIGFYGDGEPYTEYIRPSQDIDAALQAFCEAWVA